MGGEGKDKDKKKRKSESGSEEVKKKKKKENSKGDEEIEGGPAHVRSQISEGGGASKGGSGGRKKVRIQVCKEAEGTTGTLVACFSDAPPPVDDLESDQGICFTCEAQGSRKRTLTGETKSLVFEGSDSTGLNSAYKYMVGLFDPEKNEVVVVDPGEERTGNVIQLKRKVKSMAGGGQLGELTREQAREALVDGFGSKRVRSVHKQRKGQELEKEGEETLGRLGKELQVKKEENAIAKAAAGIADDEGPSDLAPKCNLKAASPSEAYARKDVVTDEEWESLPAGQILDMAKEPAGEAATQLPSFIRAQLSELLGIEDKKERRRKAKLLMYCAFLLLFNALPARFNKNAQALRDELGMPLCCATQMLLKYAEVSDRGFARPQASRDKLLLALCVLSLMYSNYEVQFNELASDLRLHPDKLSTYFREVGAVVTKPKSQAQTAYTAKLSVPLTFPKRSRGPMKGRG